MRRYPFLLLLAACGSLALGPRAAAQAGAQVAEAQGTETGYGIFQKECTSCHGNPAYGTRAPDPAALRQMTPEAIYASLATGAMAPIVGHKLTDEEKRLVAQSVSGRPLGSAGAGDAEAMPNRCASNPPFSGPLAGPAWNGWGVDAENTRFQTAPAAGLSADQVPRLKLKWAFGFPHGVSAFAQPTIAGGRVFVASDNGYVYSLDAKTGCVYWSFQAQAAMRNAISIGPVKRHGAAKWAAYVGDLKANVYAVDAANGKLLWTRHVENHFTARITGAPKLYDGRLFVPVSSFEEFSAASGGYPCCTFRGSVLALDADTGRQIWKTYVIPDEPKPTKKNAQGTQLWAPAGGSVWNSPTVDAKRGTIYFGTGDAETHPAAKTSDAVMALDMKTGKIKWVFQGTEGDAFLVGCEDNVSERSENCPPNQGPDLDFGASPILRTLPGGRRILVAGQKSGTLFGLDPDRNGALLWKTSLADKLPDSWGLIVFGGAADDQNAYFALRTSGIAAVGLQKGERRWFTPLMPPSATDGNTFLSAAVTAIPGVAFLGGSDGKLHALSTADGRILWEFNTAREFETVNGIPAKGGAMASAGSTVAGGMLFVGSGYAVISGSQAGNVLLAFSAE